MTKIELTFLTFLTFIQMRKKLREELMALGKRTEGGLGEPLQMNT